MSHSTIYPIDILYGPDRPDLMRHEILADVFEATAARIPNKIALQYGDDELSYAQLNQLADIAAHRMILAGVKPGMMVGLWLPRGLPLLILQLGIAKTGAAWLPLDADTPPERVAVCLDDAQAITLVSCAEFAGRWHHADGVAITCPCSIQLADSLLAELPAQTTLLRREHALPEHTAYVIYTSGSTGKPKGIAITQGSICHFLRSENVRLNVREDDKVYQGFSVAFDMSFEEIWISYLVGATLWIAPKEISGDPEALPRALIDHNITVLHAVPTLLALFAQDVPNLRIINLGGEMCPQALVDRWATTQRQMFNTYGPTEATVSASLAQLHVGKLVTIGEPLPNYGLLVIEVIDADSITNGNLPPLKLLPQGETGELCITGPGVAAGYLGRPDLTAEKFLPNPWATRPQDARLYRTGDLARIDEHGQVQCLGRADDQVKIRGFRVELGEIEAVLAQQPGVGTTAVILRKEDDIDQLVAFYVPSMPAPNTTDLRNALAERLPPYMVPARFEPLAAMPRLPSGKIDRKTLKNQPLAKAATAEGGDLAQTQAEEWLFAALQTLFPGQPIRREQDFFNDLGGHSLFAARLASQLRSHDALAQLTVRDIYSLRKVGAIAQKAEDYRIAAQAHAQQPRVERPFVIHSAWRRWRCGLAQATVVPFLVLLKMAQWLAPFFAYHYHTGEPNDSVLVAVLYSVFTFIAATLLEFVVALVLKRAVIGNIKPGVYPLWGLTYFRWWMGDRLLEALPMYMLSGSSLYAHWLRALGAKVGDDVIIGSITLRVPELLSIGTGSSIGNGVNLENARVAGGMLHLGRIDIGQNTGIDSYVTIEENVQIGDWAHIEGQSALVSGATVPPRRIWAGSPVQDIGEFDPASLPPRPVASFAWRKFEKIFFVLGGLLMAVIFFLPVFPTFMLIDWLDVDDLAVRPLLLSGSISETTAFFLRFLKFFVLALPASVVLILLTALIAAGIRWLFLPRMQAGRWSVHSWRYLSKWLVNQIQETSLAVLHGVYATVYSSFWYRMLGAKVGRDAEISTALGVVPDMLTLGDDTFIADAVMLGDEYIDGGWLSVAPTVIGNRTFIGNNAYVPDGTTLPDNVLLGVLSAVPREGNIKSGDTWLGSPAIHLPARETTSGYPEHLTFRPHWLRRFARGFVEAVRIASPHALVIAVGYAIVLDAMPLAEQSLWGDVVIELALAGLLFGLATFFFVAIFKWVFIGRYKPCQVPMWTAFVWLSEATTNMYEGITVPNFLRYLRGTPWLPLAMNMLGCRIAPSAYLDTTDITEFDCAYIGAHSELNALCCPQTHLFEDRVMKVDNVIIGEKVTVGARSTILYSATVGDNVQLGPTTLIMKGENIPAGSAWAGCPAAPIVG